MLISSTALYPRSPNWHRHLRQQRARARCRVRYCKRIGLPPARRDVKLLAQHHSAAPSMGKWKQGSDAKQNGWGYWHGSWSAWKPAAAATSPPALAAYDAQKPKQEGSNAAGQPPEPALDAEAGLVQGLQRAVNMARKAEGKVKRLHAEKAEKQQQWASWEQELRRTFAKERSRFLGAIARLDGEMKEALQQQADARAKLRFAASGEAAQREVEQPDPAAEEFDALMAGSPDTWEDDTSQDAVLQRALEETMTMPRVAAGNTSSRHGALTTPTRGTAAAPMTPNLTVSRAADGRAAVARPMPAARMVPFPPPVGRPEMEVLATSASLKAATADPYLAEDCGGLHAAVSGVPSPVWGAAEDSEGQNQCEGCCETHQACPPGKVPGIPGQDCSETRCVDGRARKQAAEVHNPRRRGYWSGSHCRVEFQPELDGLSGCVCGSSAWFWHGGAVDGAFVVRAPGHTDLFELVLGPPRGAHHPSDALCQNLAASRECNCMWMYSVQDELTGLGSMSPAFCWGLSLCCASVSFRLEEISRGSLQGWFGFGFACHSVPFLACPPWLPSPLLLRSALPRGLLTVCLSHRPLLSESAMASGLTLQPFRAVEDICSDPHFVYCRCREWVRLCPSPWIFRPTGCPGLLSSPDASSCHGHGCACRFIWKDSLCKANEDVLESEPSIGTALHALGDAWEPGRDFPRVDAFFYECLEPLGRSFLALYFLACLHLAFFACKQRPNTPALNKGIRRGRAALQGAPLWLAFAVVAYLLPVAQCTREHALPVSFETRPPASDHASAVSYTHHTAQVASSSQDLPRPPEHDSKYCVLVYFFQASPFDTAIRIEEGDTEGLVCSQVHSETYFSSDNMLVPVRPQPDARELIYLDVAPWTLRSLLVPVLIEVHSAQPCRYLEVFRGRVDFDVIRLAVGHKWIPGGRVFVGNSDTPLGLECIAQFQPGTLIRILPKGKPLKRCVPIARKIASPDRWLREACQVPADDAVPRHIGLVGVMGDWTTIPARSLTDVRSLHEAIAGHCGSPPSNLAFVAPDSHLAGAHFRGAPVQSILAVIPKAVSCSCILFLDARVLAVPITALILPFAITSLDHVLRLAGGSRPEDIPLQIEGVDSFDYVSGRFYPVHKAVVRLRVSESGVGFGGFPGHTARRTTGDDGVDPPEPSGRDDSLVGRTMLPLDELCVSAHAPQPMHVARPGQARCLPTVFAPPVIDLDDPAFVLEQAPAPPNLPTVELDAHHEGTPFEAEESESEVSSSQPTPHTWRVPVRILRFQEDATYHAIWVAMEESAADVLVRGPLSSSTMSSFPIPSLRAGGSLWCPRLVGGSLGNSALPL